MPVGFATLFATRMSRQSGRRAAIPISRPRRLRSLTRLARPHAQILHQWHWSLPSKPSKPRFLGV